jgi:hypothetical protein
MLYRGGPGVVKTDDGYPLRIRAFDDFYKFVAEKQPGDVRAEDSANPFPGILPGSAYGRMQGTALGDGSPLIWGTAEFGGPHGAVRIGISCDGNLHFWRSGDERNPK